MNLAKRLFVFWLVVFFMASGCSSDEKKKVEHVENGKRYVEKGDYKAAQIEFKNAVQIDPEYAEAYALLGENSMRISDAKAAFKAYSRLEKLDPENTGAQLKLATFFMVGKAPDKALEKG